MEFPHILKLAQAPGAMPTKFYLCLSMDLVYYSTPEVSSKKGSAQVVGNFFHGTAEKPTLN